MKFFTARITKAYYNAHIKDSDHACNDSIKCYVIQAIIPDVGEGELWICDDYPTLIYKKTHCKRRQYAQDDFMKLIPADLVPHVSGFIAML
jgi:hypothetical protein